MSKFINYEGILSYVDKDGVVHQLFPRVRTDKALVEAGIPADAAAVGNKFNKIAAELERCFQSVSDGKALVASAITDKRVPTDATATFAQMAANIMEIVLGSGNATAGDVLAGKTFTNDDGVEYEGTMPNNGTVSQSLNCGENYTIPKGYHDGNGKVIANGLDSQTNATAVASQITEGYTAWVNGQKIIGTRPAPITSVTGSISISQWDNKHSKSYSVTFTTPFDAVPNVVITYAFGASAYGITSVTRTGFECWFRYDGDGSNGKSGDAYWRADL